MNTLTDVEDCRIGGPMNTWYAVQFYISRLDLPYSVFHFGRKGQLVDLETGDTIASTVQHAELYLKGDSICSIPQALEILN